MRTEVKLQDILNEIFLLNEISEKTTLYHRSPHDFKIGQILDGSKKSGQKEHRAQGSDWAGNEMAELLLEEYRQKNHPNLPSRNDVIYTSVVPRARFLGKGRLYEVKIAEDASYHITNAEIIDELKELTYQRETGRYGGVPQKKIDQLVKAYWKPTGWLGREHVKSIEVIATKVKVVGIPDEDHEGMEIPDLRPGDTVKLNEPYQFEVFAKEDETDQVWDQIEQMKGVDPIEKARYGNILVELEAGTVLKIESADYSRFGKSKYATVTFEMEGNPEISGYENDADDMFKNGQWEKIL